MVRCRLPSLIAAAVAEEEQGEVFGPNAAVGVEIEIPEVAGLVRAFAERGFEDGFVGVVHVAIAVGVAEAAEELIDVVAACFDVDRGRRRASLVSTVCWE